MSDSVETAWIEIPEVPGLFCARRTLRPGWYLQSFAFELNDGSWAVLSPTNRLQDGLKEVGSPSIFIAPNHFHNMGLKNYQALYPDARVVCTQGALPRLKKKAPVEYHDIAELEAKLPEGVSLLVPEGTKNGEVWVVFENQGRRAWLVCDAFFNIAERATGFMGIMLRMTKTSPGLCIGGTWPWLHLRSKPAYTNWFRSILESQPPSVLLMCHGDPVSGDDLPQRLAELTTRRLG